MADNVQLPVTGTGTADVVVATDQLAGGEHVQKIKVLHSAADSSTGLNVVSEDDASSGAQTGLIPMIRRTDDPANQSGTDGDWEYLQMSGGYLWVRNTRPLVRIQTDVTRPADTTAYAVNDALSDSTSAPTSGGFTFTSAARASGKGGVIRGYQVATSNDPATTLAGEVFIFNTSVTNINDNAAFAVSDTEIKTCLGRLPFSLEDVGNNGFYGVSGIELPYVCSGSANLRFLVRVKNVYTPANAEVLSFSIVVEYYD